MNVLCVLTELGHNSHPKEDRGTLRDFILLHRTVWNLKFPVASGIFNLLGNHDWPWANETKVKAKVKTRGTTVFYFLSFHQSLSGMAFFTNPSSCLYLGVGIMVAG